jgi:hypothetical protein
MKLFNSLSLVTLISVTFTIPQHNHGDYAGNIGVSGDVFSKTVGSTNTFNDASRTPADSGSSSGNAVSLSDNSASPNEEASSSPVESTNSSESKEIKPEYRFLGLGIPRGSVKANADIANIENSQANVLGSGIISNVVNSFLGVYGYLYSVLYPPRSSDHSIFNHAFLPSFHRPFAQD